jgi:hypothetical protein
VIELPWLELSRRHIEIYLADHRAWLAASRGLHSDALWLSIYGLPLSDNAIYIRIVARTRED